MTQRLFQRALSDRDHRVDIEMVLQRPGDFVERGVDIRIMIDTAAYRADPRQPCRALSSITEQAMDIAARDQPVGAHRALAASIGQASERLFGIGTARLPHMDFIALEARAQRLARHLAQHLVATNHRFDIQQAKPRNLARRPLNPLRVGNPAAQHLIAAAQAEHGPPPSHMGEDIDLPSFAPQKGHIGQSRLRSGQHDHRRIGDRLARRDHHQLDTRFEAQGIEIVEIGDARGNRAGNDEVVSLAHRAAFEDHRIFARKPPCRAQPWHDAEPAPAGAMLDRGHDFGEQRGVAAKFVDDDPVDHRRVLGIDHRMRADDRGDHPTPVDIADQQHRHPCRSRKAHIGNVAAAQIDLGGRSCAFHHHDIGIGG
mmetsp:Transcript_4896/g.15809  ORF Transcript_4896/g.15809 Transcript_4896/m.15809 type:complete len:370 (+) Transcript_4896:2614-3723(+)